jgi:uncharacterized protein (TIGR02266 family)
VEYPPSDRRTNLRSRIIVTQVKMGDERRYFFGYARNISHTGVFIETISPRDVGEEFNIEFTIPNTDILIKCKACVIWNRRFSDKGQYEPGMGLKFVDLDTAVAGRVEVWVRKEIEAQAEED